MTRRSKTPNMLQFTWDDRKAATNARKHGVSFDEDKV
jgi:uncharacterized DUF497 family protein